MIRRRCIMRNVRLLHDRESNVFLESLNIPSCLPLSRHARFRLLCRASLFRTCTAEGRVCYNGAVHVTARENIFIPQEKLSAHRITAINIQYYYSICNKRLCTLC